MGDRRVHRPVHRIGGGAHAQDGLYTLITCSADGDTARVQGSVSKAHAGPDTQAWLGYLASPELRIVTLTVMEAGHVRGSDGGLDTEHPAIESDLAVLRRDLRAPVPTTPARLVAGLAARRAADAGPLAVVSCDNLPENGAAAARVVSDVAALLDPGRAGWIRANVSFVTTMVDRITPATTRDDIDAAEELTGRAGPAASRAPA